MKCLIVEDDAISSQILVGMISRYAASDVVINGQEALDLFLMTELLKMTELTEEQTNYVKNIEISGDNLLLLINDILDLSKIEAQMVTIEFEEFSLHHCINDVVLMQKHIILPFSKPPAKPVVY